MYEKSYEYDGVVKLWIGPKLVVFLVDPRDVEVILSSHVYIDKSAEYRFFKPWLGNGLLISTGLYFYNSKKQQTYTTYYKHKTKKSKNRLKKQGRNTKS